MAFTVEAVVEATLIHGGPRFDRLTALGLACLYGAVSRVEFEIGTGAAIPTELVLVPMLFALPIPTTR